MAHSVGRNPENLTWWQSGCCQRVGYDQLPDTQTADRQIFYRDRFEARFANRQTADYKTPNGQSTYGKCADGEGAEGIRADRGMADAHLSKLSGMRHMRSPQTHIYHGTSGPGISIAA
jgi:hypothetical protein